jgi:SAM-dependent methyltransferase
MCKSCGARGISVFYEARGVPVHSCLLVSSREEALCFPTGDIALGFCPACGFIANLLYNPCLQNYAPGYEEQQSFSPRFNAFAQELAAHLIERYNLRGKDIVEIGCGKGDFLVLLCELGNNRGLGIDPSYVPGRLESPAAERIRFIQDFYSERYAHYRGALVVCRHTLEHIDTTAAFVQTVRRTIGEGSGTVVFFEVPDVTRVLREQAFWDIYYEHCSYFSLGSLARLFRSCGFEILHLAKAFDNQYLLLEARPADGATSPRLEAENDLEQLVRDVAYFRESFRAKAEFWRQQLDRIRQEGRRAVIWGSSSKCVAFLGALDVRDEIDWVVDVNPYRHMKFLPGSGKQIVAPEFLRDYKPDTVIIMNAIYSGEIRGDLERMALNPEVMAM